MAAVRCVGWRLRVQLRTFRDADCGQRPIKWAKARAAHAGYGGWVDVSGGKAYYAARERTMRTVCLLMFSAPPVSCAVKSDHAVEYPGKSLNEGYALNHTNLIWPYEKMLRHSRAWPRLMRKLNLPETRWPEQCSASHSAAARFCRALRLRPASRARGVPLRAATVARSGA